MGSFDMKCGMTGMWIRCGDPVVLVPLQRTRSRGFDSNGEQRMPWPMTAPDVLNDYELNRYIGRCRSEYGDGAEWRAKNGHELDYNSLMRCRADGHVYVSNSGATALFCPSFAPIYGKYADYGDIDPDDSPHHAALEKRLGVSLTTMLDIMRRHSDGREMDPSKDPLPRWEATTWIHRAAWDAFVNWNRAKPFRWLHEESELLALGFTPIKTPDPARDLQSVRPEDHSKWWGTDDSKMNLYPMYEYVENGQRVVMAAEDGRGWYMVTSPVLGQVGHRMACYEQFVPLLKWAIANNMPELARRLTWSADRLLIESRMAINGQIRQLEAEVDDAMAGSDRERGLRAHIRMMRLTSRFSSDSAYELLRLNLDDLAHHGLLELGTDTPLKVALEEQAVITSAMHSLFKLYLPGQYGGQCGDEEEEVYAAAVAKIAAAHRERSDEWTEDPDCDENGNAWDWLEGDAAKPRETRPNDNLGRFGTYSGCGA